MLKVGVIGLGWAGTTHLRYLKTREDVRIVALCDSNPERRRTCEDEFEGKTYESFEPMLADGELDAVWVCTPSAIRRDPLVACADLRIPVFCEKPAELRLDYAYEIECELASRGARVQMGYVFRCMPLVREASKAIADDRIHLIQSLYCCPVSLTKELAPWFYDKSQSGGPLIDQATHNLDLLRYLFGEARDVKGLTSNPVNDKGDGYTIDEVVTVTMRFETGMLCSHVHTWVGDSWRNQMVFIGEKRVYRLDLTRGRLIVKEPKGKWDFSQDQDHMYDHQNARFLEQVKTGDWSSNPSTYTDALKTLDLTMACDRACSNGS